MHVAAHRRTARRRHDCTSRCVGSTAPCSSAAPPFGRPAALCRLCPCRQTKLALEASGRASEDGNEDDGMISLVGQVRVVSKVGSQYGQTALIVDGNWGGSGRCQVVMLTGKSVGCIKAYRLSDMDEVERSGSAVGDLVYIDHPGAYEGQLAKVRVSAVAIPRRMPLYVQPRYSSCRCR